jgi:hypothetical protein
MEGFSMRKLILALAIAIASIVSVSSTGPSFAQPPGAPSGSNP